MFSNGGIATVSERTRASVADSCYVVRVSTEDSCFDSTEQDKSQISKNMSGDVCSKQGAYLAM